MKTEGELTMTEMLPPSLFSLIERLNAEGKEGYEQYAAIRRYIQFKAREQAVPVCGTFELTPTQCTAPF